LNVPKDAYDGVTRWLDHSQASATQAHLYRYNPNAPDTAAQKHRHQVNLDLVEESSPEELLRDVRTASDRPDWSNCRLLREL